MKLEISRASGTPYSNPNYSRAYSIGNTSAREWFVEINTIDDLFHIIKETNDDIILDCDSIMIYDSCIE